MDIFSRCLEDSIFPRRWKTLILVLIPKENKKSLTFDIRACPICLLNDIEKAFERVIIKRFGEAVMEDPVLELSLRQFGFRRGRSTLDALNSTLSIIYMWTRRGGFTIAVGIDIKNTLNSIPWTSIQDALETKNYQSTFEKLSVTTSAILSTQHAEVEFSGVL